MNFLKLIPLIGAAINLVEKLVNRPRAAAPSVSAKEAKEKWERDKRSF